MRKLRSSWLYATVSAAIMAGLGWWSFSRNPHAEPSAAGALSVRLVPGETLTARFTGSKAHRFSVGVPAGDLLHLVVDQQGVDIVLAVKRPSGAVLLEVDSPNRNWGPEEVWWIAPAGGEWRLEIRPWRPAPEGRYRLRDVEIGLPTPRDRLRAGAWQAIGRSDRARAAGDLPSARRELAAAREMWRRAGRPLQAGLAEIRIAEVAAAGNDAAGEASSYQAALAVFRSLRDARQEVYALLRLGEARRRGGDLDGAWQAEAEALRLAHLRGLGNDEAAALNNQALILASRGRTRASLDLSERQAGAGDQPVRELGGGSVTRGCLVQHRRRLRLGARDHEAKEEHGIDDRREGVPHGCHPFDTHGYGVGEKWVKSGIVTAAWRRA